LKPATQKREQAPASLPRRRYTICPTHGSHFVFSKQSEREEARKRRNAKINSEYKSQAQRRISGGSSHTEDIANDAESAEDDAVISDLGSIFRSRKSAPKASGEAATRTTQAKAAGPRDLGSALFEGMKAYSEAQLKARETESQDRTKVELAKIEAEKLIRIAELEARKAEMDAMREAVAAKKS